MTAFKIAFCWQAPLTLKTSKTAEKLVVLFYNQLCMRMSYFLRRLRFKTLPSVVPRGPSPLDKRSEIVFEKKGRIHKHAKFDWLTLDTVQGYRKG